MLRNKGLAALLAAEVVSTTGSMMTWLALPWFVLSTTGSASRMGLVMAAEAAGVAICGIPAGHASARLGARRTLVLANALAGPLILLVPLVYWLGGLSFGLLMAIVFVIGGMLGPHFAAQRVVLAEILGEDEERVSSANALLQAATRMTLLLGPPLAGVLIVAIGAPAVLAVDAGTFLFAFMSIAWLVPAGRVASAEETGGVFAGLRHLMHDGTLLGWASISAVGDAAWNALFATLPFYAFTLYDGNPRIAGLLLACFGLSAVVGNALSFRIRKRAAPAKVIGVGVLAQAAPLWLLVAAGPWGFVAAALALAGLANGIVNPSLHAMMTLMIPQHVRAQALTAVIALNQLAAPAGFLGAGVLLAHYGTGPVFVLVPGVLTVAAGSRALVLRRSKVPALVPPLAT